MKSTPLYKWTLVCLSLTTLLTSLGMSIANIALPTIANEFSLPLRTVQWVVLAYLLAITVLIVNAGKLGDILGRRNVFLSGIALFTVASLSCGLSNSFEVLLISRGAQGIGAAMLIALTMAYAREAVPAAKTGTAMGLLGTMSAIGTMLGPSIGGLLISVFDWHAIFLLFLPLGLIDFILARQVLPIPSETVKFKLSQVDVVGTLLLTITLSSYALSVTLGKGKFQIQNIGLIAIAFIGLGLFIVIEKRVNNPLVDLRIFRSKELSSGLVMNAIVGTVMMSTLIVGPFYLTYALGLQEAIVGLVLSIGPSVSSVSGILAGKVVDKFGSSKAVTIGLSIMTTAIFALAFLPPLLGLKGYILSIVFLTPGYQLFLASNNTRVMLNAEQEKRGFISGILSLSRNLGLITGASVMGAVFALAAGNQKIAMVQPDAVVNAMKITYSLAGMLVFISFILSFAHHRIHSKTVNIE